MNPRTIRRAWVITLLVLATILLITDLSFSQGISTKSINPKLPTRITLSRATSTTILFPAQFSGVYALGLVFKDKDTKGNLVGTVQGWYETQRPTPILILHSLVDNLDTFMTVYMNDQLYTFELVTGQYPDVSLTLTSGNVPASSTKLPEIDEDTVVKMRPRYEPQLLADIMDLAREAPLIKASYPEAYAGYSERNDIPYISDDGFVRTTVTLIQKFSDRDAIVISGKAENLTGNPIPFDTAHVSMAVGTVLKPITVLTPTRPIPANKAVNFTAITVGDIGGGRADIALANEFRLIVDSGHHSAPSEPTVPVLPPAPLLPPKGSVK
jgi:hypothetical protein